jgi:cell division protein YceG involved in septum cleavage
MSITPLGKPKKPQSIKDIPEGMSLADWLKLKKKEKKDRVNQRLDGLIYERDPSLLSKDSDDF